MVKTYKYDDKTQLTPHFNVQEFRCKCGRNHDTLLSEELVNKLEEIYAKLNCSKIIISSGYRCIAHDKAVGGSGGGYHTKGMAADYCCYDQKGNIISTKIVSCVAQDLGLGGIANINQSYTYIHSDVRTGGRWLGNEIINYNTVTSDFYKYYGLTKQEVEDFCNKYKDEDTEPVEEPKDDVVEEPKESDTMREPIMKGIDVSVYQKGVDYNKVKSAGYEFVIIRAGYGRVATQKDPEFETHYKNAKAAGLHIGAYWYNYAISPEDALTEAKVCAEILKNHQLDMPVYYDIEEQKTFNTGRANVDKIARTFCEYMESQGYFCGIYGGQHLVENLLYPETANRFAFWYAQYLINPRYQGYYGLWQFSISGASAGNNPFGVPPVPGVSGQCDVDNCYEDYPTRIKQLKLNGYQDTQTVTPEPVITEPEPQPVVLPEPTRTLKEGMIGDDVKWLQTELTRVKYFNDDISGNFDIYTLGAVLAFQKKNGLVVDGLAGKKTITALKNAK